MDTRLFQITSFSSQRFEIREIKLTEIFFSGPLIPLNQACEADVDQCEDSNAACTGGFCLCTPNFYENNGVCGEQTLYLTVRSN